jgi:cytochrome P450
MRNSHPGPRRPESQTVTSWTVRTASAVEDQFLVVAAILLIRGQDEGVMIAEERSSQCQMLLVGGHLTLIDQLSNAVHDFRGHPEQLEKLRLDPSLIASAIEEVLRYDTPMSFVHRVAAVDLDLGSAWIRGGERILLCVAAANRDPEVFPDPTPSTSNGPGTATWPSSRARTPARAEG